MSNSGSAVLRWHFEQIEGVSVTAVTVESGGLTLGMCPAPDFHPGEERVELATLDEDSPRGGWLRELIDWAADPHHCLPSPICEVCGRQAPGVESAIESAVLRGRLI